MIVCQCILAIKTLLQPGNSQGMVSQEWVAIRAILRLPDAMMSNRET